MWVTLATLLALFALGYAVMWLYTAFTGLSNQVQSVVKVNTSIQQDMTKMFDVIQQFVYEDDGTDDGSDGGKASPLPPSLDTRVMQGGVSEVPQENTYRPRLPVCIPNDDYAEEAEEAEDIDNEEAEDAEDIDNEDAEEEKDEYPGKVDIDLENTGGVFNFDYSDVASTNVYAFEIFHDNTVGVFLPEGQSDRVVELPSPTVFPASADEVDNHAFEINLGAKGDMGVSETDLELTEPGNNDYTQFYSEYPPDFPQVFNPQSDCVAELPTSLPSSPVTPHNAPQSEMDYPVLNADESSVVSALTQNADYVGLTVPLLRKQIKEYGLHAAPSTLNKTKCLELLRAHDNAPVA